MSPTCNEKLRRPRIVLDDPVDQVERNLLRGLSGRLRRCECCYIVPRLDAGKKHGLPCGLCRDNPVALPGCT